jgi:hypothetical protein
MGSCFILTLLFSLQTCRLKILQFKLKSQEKIGKFSSLFLIVISIRNGTNQKQQVANNGAREDIQKHKKSRGFSGSFYRDLKI